MKHMPPVVVDEGDVTVLRRMAAYTWGRYAVTWPEGFEPPELAPDRELGFVAKLPAPEGGRFSRRFVRADAEVDAANGYSNVESILDEAEQRTGGDVFFERDITTAGLGRLVPYVHFRIGDVIPVRIWGRVIHLPVTSIDEVSEVGDRAGWRVHVGGQLISDRAALEADTSELERVIAQERRERADGDAAVMGVAEGAQASADGIVEDLTGVPGGSIVEAPASGAGTLGLMQSEIDAAQWAQLRLHQDQFTLHDNHLKWLSWTKHVYDFRFSLESGVSTRRGNEISTGLIDVKLNSASGMGFEIVTRPGWRGLYRVEWSEEGGGFSSGSINGEPDGTRTAAVAYSYQVDKVIRTARVYVWPEHSPAPREWVVQVIPGDAGAPRFGAPGTTLGSPTISGAPQQVEGGGIRFNSPVVADSDVCIGASGTVYSSGIQLNAGWHIRPLVDGDEGVVRFTEVKPALTWEAGAPLTGRQLIPIASQTIPRSTWVTLAEWTGLDWSSPRTATITYEVQWAKYNAWALADYYTRVTLNGAQIGYIARGTTGGMDAYFLMVLTGRSLAAEDVLKFEARATPGLASERKMSSASVDIVWS